MTGNSDQSDSVVLWMEDEPERLARDVREVADFAPDLRYVQPDTQAFPHGGWIGRLPLWPFDRDEPDGLLELLGDLGVKVAVVFSAAHPMVPPTVFPVEPEPEIEERTQATWHVAPDGSLCLLQTQGQWRPEASVTELLLKAAGWRVEYALLKAEMIDKMTECGIVNDDSLDAFVREAANLPQESTGEGSHEGAEHGGDVA